MHFDAIVIGAGFAGLYQLHCLRDRLGLRVRVLEAGGDVGGTWYWNRYPGRALRFREPRLPLLLLARAERRVGIDRALSRAAGDPRLPRPRGERSSTCGATSASARASPPRTTTRRRTAGRSRPNPASSCSATYLVTAVGCLSTANVPDIPGLKDFRGKWYHTGQWPHEGVDFAGKRVGQIGTGSTGIQAAPVIAQSGRASHRVPAHRELQRAGAQRAADAGVQALGARELRGDPRHRALHRRTATPSASRSATVADVTPEERQAIYEAAWETGGLQFRATFRDLLTDRAANETAAEFLKARIRADREGPGDRRDARRHRPSLLGQAPADRHRLLRDLQPRRTWRWSTCAPTRSSASRPTGIRTEARGSIRSTSSSSPPASTP